MKTKQLTSMGWVVLTTVFFLIPDLSIARIIYVNHSAAGSNDGSSWRDAMRELADALVKARAGDEIWVAVGVYKPRYPIVRGGTRRETSFSIPSGVALYGGFKGHELRREDRDWTMYRVVLSGDIDNNDANADGNNIAEDPDDITGGNAYHVIYTSNVNASTVVDGFTITGGQANGVDQHARGGGWYNNIQEDGDSSSPGISNCVFSGNYAESTGGAFFINTRRNGESLCIIENCTLVENESTEGSAVYFGGYSRGRYRLNLIDTKFSGNMGDGALMLRNDDSQIVNASFERNMGTGARLVGSRAVFEECFFTGNYGNGVMVFSDGMDQSTPKFINCGFRRNQRGAWVRAIGGGVNRSTFVNCVFSQNASSGVLNTVDFITTSGAQFSTLETRFTNCTFSRNHTDYSGGAIANGFFPPEFERFTNPLARFENCILWDNSDFGGYPEIYSRNNSVNYVTSSIVKGSNGSGASWDERMGVDGGNNLDVDPRFADPASPYGADGIPANMDDGLRLASIPLLSPAINAGNTGAEDLRDITTDFMGNPRLLGRVDMGAYEHRGRPIIRITDWSDPTCRTCVSTLLIPPITTPFNWIDGGQMEENEDGKSATITGKVVSLQKNDTGFEVYIKLINPYDWNTWNKKGRSYEPQTSEAKEVAEKAKYDWTFWELSEESYLKGFGEFEGKISLTPYPADFKVGFQIGVGANGRDKDFGLSGSFAYDGLIQVNGKDQAIKGNGSISVDAKP